MANKNKSAAGEILYVQTCLSDHRRDVAGMSADQRGVYEAMRVAYFQHGGPLPLDLATIYRLAEAHTPKERKAVQAVLEQKFTQESDGYRNAFCDAELTRIRTLRLVRKGASHSRWEKERANGEDANAFHLDIQMDMQTGMQNACKDDANRKPVTINQEPSKRLKDVIAEDVPSSSLQERKGNVVASVPAPPYNKADKVGAYILSSTTHTQPTQNLAPQPSCVKAVGIDDIREIERKEAQLKAIRDKLTNHTITTGAQHESEECRAGR